MSRIRRLSADATSSSSVALLYVVIELYMLMSNIRMTSAVISSTEVTDRDIDVTSILQPPHSVKVEAKSEHSFTLSWQRPVGLHDETNLSLIGYSVHYSSKLNGQRRTSNDHIRSHETANLNFNSNDDSLKKSLTTIQSAEDVEHVVSVPSDKLEALVSFLQPGIEYTVRVSATYSSPSNNRSLSASSLPFLVSTLPDMNAIDRIPMSSLQLSDDGDCSMTTTDKTSSSCDSLGTIRCVPASSSEQLSSTCVCRKGYGGRRCDMCIAGYYRTTAGDQCHSCDCPKLTSTATCVVNIALKEGRECSCHPGHRGADCDQCTGDYFEHDDRDDHGSGDIQCLHCSCLVLCPMDKGRQHCRNCSLLLDAATKGLETCRDFSNHVRLMRQQRAVKPSDGTVAVIAVLLSLTFIATVAVGLWCYRRKFHSRNQSSLWSMELNEEKISLNSSCDYQRLDAAAIGGSGRGNKTMKTTTMIDNAADSIHDKDDSYSNDPSSSRSMTTSVAATAAHKDQKNSNNKIGLRHAAVDQLGSSGHKYHTISI